MDKPCSREFPFDPLRYAFPLPITKTYFPLGFPVQVTTNSDDVIQAAEDLWEGYNARFDRPPVRVRFAIDHDSTSDRPVAVLPRGKDNMVAIVHGADNFAMADLSSGSSFAWLTPSVAKDHGHFRYHFLEPLAYLMLGALYLAPIHAACVSLNGSGVLLCGDSGEGKTSLAYTCARRGWTYVADDASHLLRPGTERRILGRHNEIRFRSNATQLFPELEAYPPVQRGNGKLDLEIKTSRLGITYTAAETRAEYCVFLKRGVEEAPSFRRFDACRAEDWFHRVLCVGDDCVRQGQKESLSALLELPILELRYRNIEEGETLLRSLVTHGG